MIEKLIKSIAESGDDALIARPADSKDLTLCQKELAEYKKPAMPKDYVDFLRIANGFAWNGIQFYSTDQVTDPDDGFTLDDIVSANEDFEERSELAEGKLLLGRSDEDLYTYDPEAKLYEVLDFTSLDQMETYSSFEELFSDMVGSAE
ncbi:MAG: YrhA family protein [Alphaproteobacteria bacterium]